MKITEKRIPYCIPERFIKYAEISERTLDLLYSSIKPEEHIVTQENIDLIYAILNLEGLTDEELTATRNTVVDWLHGKKVAYRHNADLNSSNDDLYNQYMDLFDTASTKMSMITAVIDEYKRKRGVAI